jgi:hypothetical protein
MKKNAVLLSMMLLASSTLFIACNEDDDEKNPVTTTANEVYLDASSSSDWHYYSFEQKKFVGTASESPENNTQYGAVSNWDIALQRYFIRTNSGEFTSIGSKGGIYICGSQTTFESLNKIPSDTQFTEDASITSSGMGGTTTVVRSLATSVVLQTDEEGNLVMPPVYLPAPVYIFRSADGEHYYKVQFTQYQNDEGATGHIKFKFAEISK